MNGRVSYLQGMFTKNLHLQAVFSLVKMKTSMGPQDQDGCASKTPAPQRSTLDKVMSVKAWTNIGVRFWLNKSLRWIDSSFLDFFFVCSFQLFLELMRNEKWDDWITFLHCSSKKERNQLQTFCQEFRKAQKLLSPEFRLISTWSTLDPAHRPTQIGPKSEWPKKEGGG